MAQNSVALKIVSEAFKNGGRCSRMLHDSVAVKKGLHNTDVVGMVADSMGRSRVKLTASDVERNGMTRVGPAPDILHQTCGSLFGPRTMTVLETKLGQKRWTGQQQQTASFHQSSKLAAEEECDKPGKNQLPCQKSVNIPGVRKKEKTSKGSCEKLCMPCCEPAKDPPECVSIYQKGPCTKFKNPRPSFSECRKRFPFKHTMCECEVPAKPRCEQKKKQGDSTC